MAFRTLADDILDYVRRAALRPGGPPGPQEIAAHLSASRRTVNRAIAALVKSGQLEKLGAARATRYRATGTGQPAAPTGGQSTPQHRYDEAAALRNALSAPLGTRLPVTYDPAFVHDYVPNESSLLPQSLADELHAAGRAKDQQPAGTVARKVLEQLLIDLSWHSSRLEGNPISFLDTKAIFERGDAEAGDPNVTMLLNHKQAIEFTVDTVPLQGITVPVIRNLHALLMQGLLDDPLATGAIRRRVVTIEGSVYHPTNVPQILEQMLDGVVTRARAIRNPIEGAFFLWVNLAYLQPFEDGNKRTSRIAANLPLLLSNCAPLSFLDVDRSDYAYAMLGVYEQRSVALAIELFEATYRRSIEKYQAALGSFGTPDPVRAKYRNVLSEAIRRVVVDRIDVPAAIATLEVDAADVAPFTRLVDIELQHLEIYNYARFKLAMPEVERWVAAGRPGISRTRH